VGQTIGTTLVTVAYHRPAVKGRPVWGGLVPLGQVWRLGANEATTISFSDPVMVNGQKVPAGTYALFAIPNAERWTLVLNRRAKQQGAWEYDHAQDLIRFDVKPKAAAHTEWLTFEIYPAGYGTAYIDLYWEKLRVSFLVEADVDEIVSRRMRRAMAANPGDWKLFADAATFSAEQEIHLGEALGWADRALKLNPGPQSQEARARVLHALRRDAEAIQTLEKALKEARARKLGPAILGPMEATLTQWKRNGNGGK
jgi:tetratricopeptide (TPR) repeat protein